MKKLNLNWTVNQFMSELNKGKVSFTYPIQRAGEQWDLWQKSLLIHSLSEDFPVPSLYAIEEELEVPQKKDPSKVKKVKVYQILDGKQRLTNINAFINLEYALHEDTPNAVIDGESYELAERRFDELDQVVQDAIQNFGLLIYKIEDATDEQIEDIFIRLNNGTPLSKQQKSKGAMGADWAKLFTDIMSHNAIIKKASFTPKQKREAQDEMTIVQTMMLLDKEYTWNSISSNEIEEYAKTFRGNEQKKEIVAKIVEALDYIDKAFADKEAVILKKVHFPMTILASMKAMEMGVDPVRFSDWRDDFKQALKGKKSGGYIPTDYKKYGGAGSVKKDKVNGRIDAMQEHLEEFFKHSKVLSVDSIVTEETTTEGTEVDAKTVLTEKLEEVKKAEEEKQEQTA
jgi:hypothetical protein